MEIRLLLRSSILTSFARRLKVRWFQWAYREEMQDKDVIVAEGQHPSIVAHSFGTYILGHALLKYDWLTFNKVILCGSILPQDFPWDKLIERGQVQAVRNEHGVRDIWTGLVRWFVAGTGPSGRHGFKCSHGRFEQEKFVYAHSEYFEKGHMEAKWLPFLGTTLPVIPAGTTVVERPRTSRPWGLYAVQLLVVALLLFAYYQLRPKVQLPGTLTWTEVRLSPSSEKHLPPLDLVDDVLKGDQYPGGSQVIKRVEKARKDNGYEPPDAQWKAFQCSLIPANIGVKTGVNAWIAVYVFTEANERWVVRKPQSDDVGPVVNLEPPGSGQDYRLLLLAIPLDSKSYTAMTEPANFIEVTLHQ